MITYIYVLKHPTTNEIRYVGKTINIKQRFNNHINRANKLGKKNHLYCWIRTLLDQNLIPSIEIIEECNEDWETREIYWIAYYKNKTNLTNSTKGGEGRAGLRLFEEEIINVVLELIDTGLYFHQEIESKLGMCKGYISNLFKRRNLVLPKSKKKRVLPSRKGCTFPNRISKRYSGKGYYFSKQNKKWIVRDYVNGKQIIIGSYLTEQEAIDKRKNIFQTRNWTDSFIHKHSK